MGYWLTRLKNEKARLTHATKPTKPHPEGSDKGFVGFVAPCQGTSEKFIEPPGYEGTGWRLAGAEGLSAETLARFYAASQALDRLKLH